MSFCSLSHSNGHLNSRRGEKWSIASANVSIAVGPHTVIFVPNIQSTVAVKTRIRTNQGLLEEGLGINVDILSMSAPVTIETLFLPARRESSLKSRRSGTERHHLSSCG